jgi:hypothetical protein
MQMTMIIIGDIVTLEVSGLPSERFGYSYVCCRNEANTLVLSELLGALQALLVLWSEVYLRIKVRLYTTRP